MTSMTEHISRGGPLGTNLVPTFRPLWAGGLADLFAHRRHERRARARAADQRR